MGMQEPILHAQAIKGRGAWIPGVIDPAARGRSQIDGRQLIQIYRECGLHLEEADNTVEAGIYQVWQLMSSGKLKVFRSLGNWLSEFRIYQRDTGRKNRQAERPFDGRDQVSDHVGPGAHENEAASGENPALHL